MSIYRVSKMKSLRKTLFHVTINIIIYSVLSLDSVKTTPFKISVKHRPPPLSLYTASEDDCNPSGPPEIHGFRLEAPSRDILIDHEGIPDLLYHKQYNLRLFGIRFVKDMLIAMTAENASAGKFCEFPVTQGFPVLANKFTEETCLVAVSVPILDNYVNELFLCVKEGREKGYFLHQGTEAFLQIYAHMNILPLWAMILIICLCLSFSFLLSGLNIGLLSMDKTELRVLCNAGSENEKKYAAVILPVRKHGNFLLCSILIANTFVNAIFTVLMDSLTSGLTAVIASTIALTLLGEIMPQALCNKYGLVIGARTMFITKTIMALTFPLSYPLAKILDYILGEEIRVFNRERLRELISIAPQNVFQRGEVNIISGALELHRKTVAEVMIDIEEVYMLDYESVLDFDTVSAIMNSGYSRIPVYEGNRKNIVTVLYAKDLALIDPDDRIPLKTICQFYQNPCSFVFEDVTLDVMFRSFKEGNKGHMAIVHRLNKSDNVEPFYESIGLVTLEDVLEELIQEEIHDETDVTELEVTTRRRFSEKIRDFNYFASKTSEEHKTQVSPQLTLTAYQFLSTSLEEFQTPVISETILMRLLKRDIFYSTGKSDFDNVIYEAGVSADYFVLILEGKVEVVIGVENLVFEAGALTYFGTQALVPLFTARKSSSFSAQTARGSERSSLDSWYLDTVAKCVFQPDYTVKAMTDEVIYLKIKGRLYLTALKATLLEQSTDLQDDDGRRRKNVQFLFDEDDYQ